MHSMEFAWCDGNYSVIDNLYVWIFYTSKSNRRIKKISHCEMLYAKRSATKWRGSRYIFLLAYKPDTLNANANDSERFHYDYDIGSVPSATAQGSVLGVSGNGSIYVAWGPTDDDSKAYELLKESVFSSMDRQIEAAVEKINGWNKMKTDFVALTQ